MASPSIDTSKPIIWQDPDDNGKFTGTKKVTAQIGDNKRHYTITIRDASSKEDAQALLDQKIQELVSVAILVNVQEGKSLVYRGGSYSTLSHNNDDPDNPIEKEVSYLSDGCSEEAITSRVGKGGNRHTFYNKIAPIIKGLNSDIDDSVKQKIQNKEKLTHDDLRKIDPDIKVEYFHEETDISDLTAEIVERKIQKWKQVKQLAELSIKFFNIQDVENDEDDDDDEADPTPPELIQQGLNYLYGNGGVDKNEDRGIALIKEASEKGSWEADSILCRHYFNKDIDQALVHGLKAAEHGDVECQNFCIEIYRRKNNLEKMFEMLEQSAALNNPAAHYTLAESYLSGQGVDQNEDKAKEHYEKVIEHKDKPSLLRFNKECLLAKAHFVLDQKEEAREILEQADDTNEQAKQLLNDWFPQVVVIDDD